MIYSRLPDLFLSSLPFSLSSFPLFPFHSLPFYIASSAKSLPLSSSSVSCAYLYSQSRHIHQLTVISSSSTMLLVYRPHPAS